MQVSRIFLICLIAFASLTRPVTGEPTAGRRTFGSPREAALIDAADGRLDEFTLAAAAISISFVQSEAEMRSFLDQIESFSKRLARRLAGEERIEERAGTILRFLHERILVGEYDAGCCDLRQTLNDGTYNCVTGTILFRIFSDLHGLDSNAVVAPAHVRCCVADEGGVWNVETTTRDGVTRAPSRDGSIRKITDVELVAKLIYNQGLRSLERDDFAAALEATELSWQLDPRHDAARENVAVVVNNWSLRLAADGNYAQAVELLDRGHRVSPEVALIRSNQLHVLLRWIDAERRAFREAQVARVMERARELFPDYPAFSASSSPAASRWAE